MKLNLLFDASTIIEGFSSRNFSRSGIYWVACNLLYQFSCSARYKISLLVPPCSSIIKKRILNHFKYPFEYITFYDKIVYINNVDNLISKIKKTSNVIKVCYYILNIIKNKIFIILSKKILDIHDFHIYFSPRNYIPQKIINIKSINSYQMLYDCIPSIFTELYPFIDDNHWYINVIKNLNKKTYYFCISESTRNDFLNHFSCNLDKEKMYVTPIASSLNIIPQYSIDTLNNILRKYNAFLEYGTVYILSICTIEPRKNLIFTIKCFIEFIKKHKIKNCSFLIGGGYFPGYLDYFKQEINKNTEYLDKIILLGYVDDDDLNILYSNSLFFVFLSQYEGFGMTVLEAMQAGTPVICSNNSSLPEVAGNAAWKIQYDDASACIDAMEKLYFNAGLRNEYISKGLDRAKQFSWEKTYKTIDSVIMNNLF